MINLIKSTVNKEMNKTYFKVFMLITIVTGIMFSYLSIKNYKIETYPTLEEEYKLNEKQFNQLYEYGTYKNYEKQYIQYNKEIKKINLINNNIKPKKLLGFNNIFIIEIFIMIFCIFIANNMYNYDETSGILKYNLTKGLSRPKVIFSYVISLIILCIILNLTLFISFTIGSLFKLKSLELFKYKIPIVKNNIKYINYYLYIFIKFIIYMLPIIFISILTLGLVIMTSNSTISFTIPLILSIFGLNILETLLKFKLKFLSYTFIPYLDFTIFNNKLDVINFNIDYGINITLLNGTIILIVNIILIIIITLTVFNKKDIK